MKKAFVLIAICAAFIAFKAMDPVLFSFPENWPKPAYDFTKNPLSEARVQLGRALFYDPILSLDSSISCESCHSQYTAFTHVDHSLSHGIGNRMGTRNAPALMNLAWGKSFMWDGAINHLDMQALAPLSHPDEMGEKMAHVVDKLQHSNIYPALYYKSYGDSIITGEHTLKAISQFLLTLISANAKYDSVMRKESNFTKQEANGYKLFRQNCAACHKEPLFTNQQFESNGLPLDTALNDYGRYKVTANVNDSFLFKVPTLRNIQFSNPYMHDGRFKRLNDVLKHYTTGIVHSKHLSKQLTKPIILSTNDRVDLVAFLLTLTDKTFLFNPFFSYPKDLFSN